MGVVEDVIISVDCVFQINIHIHMEDVSNVLKGHYGLDTFEDDMDFLTIYSNRLMVRLVYNIIISVILVYGISNLDS